MLLSHFLILNREKWNFQVVLLVVKTQRIFSIKDTVLHVWGKLNSIFGYRSFVLFFCGKQKNWNWTLHIVTCWLRTSIISRAFFIFSSKLFILCVKRKTERYSEKIFFSFSRIFHFWGFLMMLILATAMTFFEIFSTKIQYVYMSWFMYEQSPIHR